jgi:hypothetical protein
LKEDVKVEKWGNILADILYGMKVYLQGYSKERSGVEKLELLMVVQAVEWMD